MNQRPVLFNSGAASFDDLPWQARQAKLQAQKDQVAQVGPSPFFRSHEGSNGGRTVVDGRLTDNFSSYNYLGLTTEPLVLAAARAAIDRFGTSVSASRLVSGEISLHRELERTLADFVGTQDCLTYVSGYGTNVSTLGHLFGRKDIIFHDDQMHFSGLSGSRLSEATRVAFRHNDMQHLGELMSTLRPAHQRALILVEGIYSMEGDIAPLPALLQLKARHDALLMVDEAHSIGVLGAGGRGLREHFGIHAAQVDLWMGTLSKALASCGGYIAGDAPLIDYLRHTSPGFVYSVGMSPSNAAAALAALRCIQARPECVQLLHERARYFMRCAVGAGLDTGRSAGTPIIPVMMGDSRRALAVSQRLFCDGIQVAPIFHPAVGRREARLRFFISVEHSESQIHQAVERTADALWHLHREARCDAHA